MGSTVRRPESSAVKTLDQLTPLYAAVLVGVALTWLWQLAQSARRSLWPRLGWLMPLGLGALLAAPVFDVPALFGAGAGFALIAAYWPVCGCAARRAAGERAWPGWASGCAAAGDAGGAVSECGRAAAGGLSGAVRPGGAALRALYPRRRRRRPTPARPTFSAPLAGRAASRGGRPRTHAGCQRRRTPQHLRPYPAPGRVVACQRQCLAAYPQR